MKTFKMLEMECDETCEIYGNTIEEAIVSHALDYQYEVNFPVLAKENNEWYMYAVDVIEYPNRYKAYKMDTPIVKYIVEEEE